MASAPATGRNRFQEEWLSDPNFQPWLVKVSNDISRAYCRYCAVVLRAHKTDISHHGTTAKHQNNTKLAVESGTATNTPISVQIVFNEGDVDMGGDNQSNNIKDMSSTSSGGMQASVPSVDLNNSIVNSHVTPANNQSQQFMQQQSQGNSLKRPSGSDEAGGTTRRYACKRYRVEWESDPILKDWVKAYKHDPSKAYCRVCETPLRAHKHDLVLHAKSSKHTKQASFFDFSADNDGNNTNSSDSFEDASGIVGAEAAGSNTEGPNNELIMDNIGLSNKTHHNPTSNNQHLHQLKLESVDAILMNARNNIITADPGNMIVSLPNTNHATTSTNTPDPDIVNDHHNQHLSSSGGEFDTSNKSSSVEQRMIRITRRINSGGFRRRQMYINAADVVAAIANNEFTGYELLQIVKAAVPKL